PERQQPLVECPGFINDPVNNLFDYFESAGTIALVYSVTRLLHSSDGKIVPGRWSLSRCR
ncbi:MAG: hypothetical protein N2C12_18825, partial [Planctomycetales bacterium]